MSDKRVARGVWKTSTGWRVFVYKTDPPQSQRLPEAVTDPTTGLVKVLTLKDVKQWRQGWETDLLRGVEPLEAGVPSTFRHDVVTSYLPAVAAMPDYPERVRHMKLWIAEFGDIPRHAIEPVRIRTVLTRWLTIGPKLVMRKATEEQPAHYDAIDAPLSAQQVTLRKRALRNFFTVMNGRHGKNPVREIADADPADRPPRALPWKVVEAILAAMPDRGQNACRSDGSKTKARIRVMVWTGLAHSQLARVQPADLDLQARTLFRRRRKKGQALDTKPKTIPLLPQAVEAFKTFIALDCFGPFSRSSMWKSFQRAAKKLGLEGIRPYDLRHTFATDTVQAVGNLDLAQELLGHASKETTRQYAEAAINPLVAAAFERFTARVTQTRKPSATATRSASAPRKPSVKPSRTRTSAVKAKTSRRRAPAF
jgi:integrase